MKKKEIPVYVPDTTRAFLQQCREQKTRRGLDPTLDTTDDFLQECRDARLRTGFIALAKETK